MKKIKNKKIYKGGGLYEGLKYNSINLTTKNKEGLIWIKNY